MPAVVVALEVVAEQLRAAVERVVLALVRDQPVRGGCGQRLIDRRAQDKNMADLAVDYRWNTYKDRFAGDIYVISYILFAIEA